ncbi:MAG: hypothetical protein PHU63_04720 [Candidatus ainarchaeum sp.]|nr:hypothetical protein [Candidatus ainarchaeum sp.]
MSIEIINEKPVPIAEVKDLIGKRKEYSYRQKLALEHAKDNAKLSLKNTQALIEDLKKLEIRRLREKDIIKIADMVPKTIDDLKVIVSGSATPLIKDEMEKVIEIVKKYA